MAFAEDLDVFVNPDDFGIAATWSVGPKSIYCLFDTAYVDPLGQFEGYGPVALVKSADVSGVAQGQTMTIAGTVYTIVEVRGYAAPGQPDILELRLRK